MNSRQSMAARHISYKARELICGDYFKKGYNRQNFGLESEKGLILKLSLCDIYTTFTDFLKMILVMGFQNFRRT